MSTESDLIPVFIPPLATMLAQAEKTKGKPLTETEVIRVRDKAVCMTMASDRAEKMTEKRGYVDVNPETCWSDWHRLRVQMTGNGFLPKLILCLVGDRDFADASRPILEKAKIEHEFRERDERIVKAFKAATYRNPFDESELEQVAGHETVLYILSGNYRAQDARAISTAFLRNGARLLEAGGVAIKCESSGIGHSREAWLDLAKGLDADDGPWMALLQAYVQMPIGSDDDLYSCGMHLLGQPDLIMSHFVIHKATDEDETNVAAVAQLFDIFAQYLLGECREGAFGSGHTFSIAKDAPRFRLLWEPCTGYDEDDFFFNPFGRWRFTNA